MKGCLAVLMLLLVALTAFGTLRVGGMQTQLDEQRSAVEQLSAWSDAQASWARRASSGVDEAFLAVDSRLADQSKTLLSLQNLIEALDLPAEQRAKLAPEVDPAKKDELEAEHQRGQGEAESALGNLAQDLDQAVSDHGADSEQARRAQGRKAVADAVVELAKDPQGLASADGIAAAQQALTLIDAESSRLKGEIRDLRQRKRELQSIKRRLEAISPQTEEIRRRIDEVVDQIEEVEAELKHLNRQKRDVDTVRQFFSVALKLAAIFALLAGNPLLALMLWNMSGGGGEGGGDGDGDGDGDSDGDQNGRDTGPGVMPGPPSAPTPGVPPAEDAEPSTPVDQPTGTGNLQVVRPGSIEVRMNGLAFEHKRNGAWTRLASFSSESERSFLNGKKVSRFTTNGEGALYVVDGSQVYMLPVSGGTFEAPRLLGKADEK